MSVGAARSCVAIPPGGYPNSFPLSHAPNPMPKNHAGPLILLSHFVFVFHSSRLIPGVQSLSVGASFLFSGLHSRSRSFSFSFSFYTMSTFFFLFFLCSSLCDSPLPLFRAHRYGVGSAILGRAGWLFRFVLFHFSTSTPVHFVLHVYSLRYITFVPYARDGETTQMNGKGDIVLCKYYRRLFFFTQCIMIPQHTYSTFLLSDIFVNHAEDIRVEHFLTKSQYF